MTLIEFIKTSDIDVGWTKGGYGEIKDGKVMINVPRFLAQTIIHEHIHHTMPHARLDEDSCSAMVRKKAKLVLGLLSESALREIADEVVKVMVKTKAKAKHKRRLPKRKDLSIKGGE